MLAAFYNPTGDSCDLAAQGCSRGTAPPLVCMLWVLHSWQQVLEHEQQHADCCKCWRKGSRNIKHRRHWGGSQWGRQGIAVRDGEAGNSQWHHCK